jgi:alkylation response protein AidB-like acyl-CoA dehydrogenase
MVASSYTHAAVQLCKTKTPAYKATPLREQQLAQFQMGKARSRVEASRDTLYRAAEAVYDDVVRSTSLLSVDAKIRLQLAACFAAEACAEAVRLVNVTFVMHTYCCSTLPSPVRAIWLGRTAHVRPG